MVDARPPATITDLVVTAVGASSITLVWTVPGDDGTYGRASQYDIRLSTENVQGNEWSRTTRVPGPTPGDPWTQDTVVVAGLSGGRSYFFAIRTVDEANNWSEWSNVAYSSALNTPPQASFAIVRPCSHSECPAPFAWVGTPLTFDAGMSTDEEDETRALEVRWDWEDDGRWDTEWSTEKTASHEYATAGGKLVRLEVRDMGGGVASSTVGIEILSLNGPDDLINILEHIS